MALSSLLLRVLLSLSLVLNGSGYVFASAHAGMAAHAQASTGTAPHAPCQEAGGTAERANVMDAASATAVVSDTGATSQADTDCCQADACRCACMHGVVAAMAILARSPVIVIRDTAVRPLLSAHPSPALPHLIRPPIG